MLINDKPIVIDLFSGAGGLSLGAARAGFQVACSIEIDKFALETHTSNFPTTLHLPLDISQLTGNTILKYTNLKKGQLNGLIGGPPCQGFSTIGRRSPTDTRNNLFVSFFRLVKQLQPHFFLAENVPGLLNNRFDNIREEALNHVKKDYIILPPLKVAANEFGAPTSRTRIFFIGYKHKYFKEQIDLSSFELLRISQEEQTIVKKALSGLPTILSFNPEHNGWDKVNIDWIKKSPNGFFERNVSGKIPEGIGNIKAIEYYFNEQKVSGCIPTLHSPEIEKRYKELAIGKIDPISKSQKLDPDGFCPTLRAGTGPEKGSYQAVRPIHFIEPRVITPREAARLQGFPDWFMLHKTKWHSFRQIGNSVSPIVAEKLLKVIYQNITW